MIKVTGKPPPGSRNQLFNVNWFLGHLFHWSTGSLVNWFTASPSSTNKVAPNSWKWVTRSNQQSRSILLEMCLLDAWRRCNQQSAIIILETCLLDAWRMLILVFRFGWLGQPLEPCTTLEEFHGFNCSMWTGSLVAYFTGGPGQWTTDSQQKIHVIYGKMWDFLGSTNPMLCKSFRTSSDAYH